MKPCFFKKKKRLILFICTRYRARGAGEVRNKFSISWFPTLDGHNGWPTQTRSQAFHPGLLCGCKGPSPWALLCFSRHINVLLKIKKKTLMCFPRHISRGQDVNWSSQNSLGTHMRWQCCTTTPVRRSCFSKPSQCRSCHNHQVSYTLWLQQRPKIKS